MRVTWAVPDIERILVLIPILSIEGILLVPTSYEDQFLEPLEPFGNTMFGTSVSILGDRAVIGSLHETFEDVRVGGVFVFERDSNGDWVQVDRFTGSVAEVGDKFGENVYLSVDRMLVGAETNNLAEIGRASCRERV